MINFDVNDTLLADWIAENGNRDLHPALEEIGQLLVDSVHGTIDTEGHGDWEAPAWDYGHALLQDTGALYNSIYYEIQGESVNVDVGVSYGRYQNEGTSRIPARPFLVMQDEDQMAIEEIIARLFS
jgi:phage gpG-like protein